MASGNEAQSWASQHSTHLPSWRRTSLLMRPPSIRVLPKDNNQLQDKASNEGFDFDSHSYVDLPQNVQQLQRNVSFLKKQHLDTLQQLHKELERLKKENKGYYSFWRKYIYLSNRCSDLSFKLVMCKCGQPEVKTGEAVKAADARLRAGEQSDRQRCMCDTPNVYMHV